MRILVVLAAVIAVGCGGNNGGSTPTTPTPPPLPAATITPSGSGSWAACLGDRACLFQGEARNTGAGCASHVRGVVRFYGSQQQQVGSAAWALDVGRIVRPNEAFVYRSTVFVEGSVIAASQGGTYESEAAWTNVPCN